MGKSKDHGVKNTSGVKTPRAVPDPEMFINCLKLWIQMRRTKVMASRLGRSQKLSLFACLCVSADGSWVKINAK
jgi:hypothetical protein